jgi:subtilase family serine protease
VAHAIAPQAKILLVEAPNGKEKSLLEAAPMYAIRSASCTPVVKSLWTKSGSGKTWPGRRRPRPVSLK